MAGCVLCADICVRVSDTGRVFSEKKPAENRVGTVFAYMFSVMENIKDRIVEARGSIMLEYVIVLCGIGVALIVFLNRWFYNTTDGFGSLGQGIVAFYQRLQGGLSLPIP